MTFLIAVLAHTPPWVWAGLALIVAVGLNQARARDVPAARLVVLPIVFGAWSLWNATHGFAAAGEAIVVASWGAGLLAGAGANVVLDLPRGCRPNPDGSIRVPGSFAPLVLMLGVFVERYVAGVALAVHPARAADAVFAATAAFAFALPVGLLAARSRKALACRRAAAALGVA